MSQNDEHASGLQEVKHIVFGLPSNTAGMNHPPGEAHPFWFSRLGIKRIRATRQGSQPACRRSRGGRLVA